MPGPAVDGALPQDVKGEPASGVYTPNVGTVALQGGSVLTDGTGQPYAPAVVQATISSITNPITSNIAGPASTDNYTATVTGTIGELRVAQEATQTFYDAFDTVLDTANRWKLPVAGGGGIAASSTLTFTALGSGVVANGFSYLESQMAFLQANPGWVLLTLNIAIEFPVLTNTYRFWGFGTSPLTPTTSAPLTDAAGFEVATTGKMYAVMYQGGTRNVIQDLSTSTGNSKQPGDSNPHNYLIYYRGDRTFWAIDNIDNYVASTSSGAVGPNVNALPIKMTAIAAPTPPLSNVQLTCNAVWVGDTARNNKQISDGVFPWRKVTVTQLHNADNLSLPSSPASYGILSGGVAQLLNSLGNLDRQREAGQDQVSSLGISAGAMNFAQAFQTSVPSGNIAVGAASALIAPASMFGIQVGALLTLDTGASVETAVVTSVGSTGTTATIVPTNLSGSSPAFKYSHTVPYQITGFVYNQERDQNGELDSPRGLGMAVAMPMLSLSSGQGASSPIIAVRERGVQGLGLSPSIAIVGSVAAGSTSFTLASAPTGLLAGTALYLTGGGGYERVLTSLSYTSGSTTITLDPATPVQGAARTSVQYMVFAAGGPVGAAFYPEGEGAEFQAMVDLTATSGPPGRLLQVATQNSAPYANSPLEAIGLDNNTSLDRMAGNQSLALINAVNVTTIQTTPDLININARGVKVFINMISSSMASIIVSIQFKDPWNNYVTMLSSTAMTAAGTATLSIHPGFFNVANTSINDFLPRTWRIQAIPNNSNPCTYTIGAMTVI